MNSFNFILSILLLLHAAKIDGVRYCFLDEDLEDSDETETNDENSFAPQTPPLTPADVEIQPSFEPTASNAPIVGRLLTPAEGCGFSPIANSRFVGGAPAKNGAWPWAVLLAYRASLTLASFNCGGSLITSRHVLSAAHCMNTNLWFVRLGEYDVSTVEDGSHEDIEILHFQAHQQYDSRLTVHDIAMVYLNRDVEFNNRIRPICLPLDEPLRSQKFVGANPFVVGWGTLREHGAQSSVLQQIQVPIVDNKFCKQIYKKHKAFKADSQFSDVIICAGYYEGVNSCHGDSGGPLMLPIQENGTFPFYQFGVVSWGIPCAQSGIPAIYASVQHYARWIRVMLEK